MPPNGGSGRSRAGKANYAKRELNELNEPCPGPVNTTKKATTETTEAPESTDPVIQLFRSHRQSGS